MLQEKTEKSSWSFPLSLRYWHKQKTASISSGKALVGSSILKYSVNFSISMRWPLWCVDSKGSTLKISRTQLLTGVASPKTIILLNGSGRSFLKSGMQRSVTNYWPSQLVVIVHLLTDFKHWTSLWSRTLMEGISAYLIHTRASTAYICQHTQVKRSYAAILSYLFSHTREGLGSYD